MMRSLRARLLTSYVMLLMVTLIAILAMVVITTGARKAPPQTTWQRLTAVARGLDWGTLLRGFAQNLPPGSEQNTSSVADVLDYFSDSSGARVIWLRTNAQQETFVLYDSAAIFQTAQTLPVSVEFRRGAPDSQSILTMLPGGLEQVHGGFVHGSEEWLFSGFRGQPIDRSLLDNDTNRPAAGAQRDGVTTIMVATVRPTQSLQDVLVDFGTDLIFPLMQAAAVSLIIAFILAYLITRTIARPLQALSRAAEAIAHGDHDHLALVEGPTEVRAVAEAFNYMSHEVRMTQQAQHDFLGNVSHDLKTPLTTIQGFSQAIIDGTAKEPERAASVIYDEAARLTRLVNTLTDLTRLQAGQLSLQISHLDVCDLVKAVVQNLQVMAQRKNIALTMPDVTLPEVAGDGDRLVQVFNNLIGNAIKYTQEGGQVQVKARTSEGGVEVIVQDNGMGIPKDDLPRIFERFYQVDKARGPKRGTGLGLAITYEIVQMHGGKINVQSIEGQGPQFTVWLPLAHKAQTAVRQVIRRDQLH